jgi:hypothetical protein
MQQTLLLKWCCECRAAEAASLKSSGRGTTPGDRAAASKPHNALTKAACGQLTHTAAATMLSPYIQTCIHPCWCACGGGGREQRRNRRSCAYLVWLVAGHTGTAAALMEGAAARLASTTAAAPQTPLPAASCVRGKGGESRIDRGVDFMCAPDTHCLQSYCPDTYLGDVCVLNCCVLLVRRRAGPAQVQMALGRCCSDACNTQRPAYRALATLEFASALVIREQAPAC